MRPWKGTRNSRTGKTRRRGNTVSAGPCSGPPLPCRRYTADGRRCLWPIYPTGSVYRNSRMLDGMSTWYADCPGRWNGMGGTIPASSSHTPGQMVLYQRMNGRMNTLVVLLVTTFAPGAEPVQLVQSPSIPSSNYAESGWSGQTQENRPRWFPRLRGFFTRRSQGNNPMPSASLPASYPTEMTGSQPGTVLTPAPTTSSGTSVISTIGPGGNNWPPAHTPQRMPIGEPSGK
jgi:hypothetical protein